MLTPASSSNHRTAAAPLPTPTQYNNQSSTSSPSQTSSSSSSPSSSSSSSLSPSQKKKAIININTNTTESMRHTVNSYNGSMNVMTKMVDNRNNADDDAPLSPTDVVKSDMSPNSSFTQISSVAANQNLFGHHVNSDQFLSNAIAAVSLKSNHADDSTLHLDASLSTALASNGKLIDLNKQDSSPQQSYKSTFNEEQQACLQVFNTWTPVQQTEFVENLLKHMCHFQHGHINSFLKPMLQRDFISLLPARGLLSIAEIILSYLDAKSLLSAEIVSKDWQRIISDGQLWKKLIERKVNTDSMWNGLSQHRGWHKYLFKLNYNNFANIIGYNSHEHHKFYQALYAKIIQDIRQLNQNWNEGNCVTRKIHCRSENSKGVYCLQYDNEKIISGLRDNTIKIWDKKKGECLKTLTGHSGSVLCLQYDQNIIVSGSSDTSVRVWDIKTGQNVHTLHNHKEAVLHLRFMDGLMVTCSKDRQIIVWDINSPTDIQIKRTLVGHRAAVNVVDFDNRYIVSASGDRTIKVWHTSTCEFVRTLTGHKRGIACLQYRGNLVVSGSSDFTIRLWDIESGECLRVLEGHDELVRCIRFDNKRIVSGAYDGKIKIWDLKLALEQRLPSASVCLRTLTEHTGRVFRLQFDEFQIVSSSHDDSIIVWDFLNYNNGDDSKVNGSNNTSNTLVADYQSSQSTMVASVNAGGSILQQQPRSPQQNHPQRTNNNYSPSSPIDVDE